MTSDGSAYTRFKRALAHRDLFGAEIAAKEMGGLSLVEALDYLALLVELKPEKAKIAALRWHGRFELEATMISLSESQLALSAITSFCDGDRDSLDLLRRLLKRVHPSVIRRIA